MQRKDTHILREDTLNTPENHIIKVSYANNKKGFTRYGVHNCNNFVATTLLTIWKCIFRAQWAQNTTLIKNRNTEPNFPQELSIKTEGDVLIVLAKHETKAEGGQSFVSKQFEQRFSLPSGVKPEKISSSLSKVPFDAVEWYPFLVSFGSIDADDVRFLS